VACIIAGLLGADVLALLSGNAPPSERHQLEVDSRTLAVHRHPVLPLPYEIVEAGEARDDCANRL
jgi:hypothetical protein